MAITNERKMDRRHCVTIDIETHLVEGLYIQIISFLLLEKRLEYIFRDWCRIVIDH